MSIVYDETRFDPRPIAEVKVTISRIKAVAKGQDVTRSEAESEIEKILERALMLTLQDGHDFIDTYVPCRTGKLRASLHRQLDNSYVYGTILKLIMGSSINYVPFVDAMSNSHLQHFGNSVRYNGQDIELYDPQAQKHFMGYLIMKLRQKLRQHLQEARKYEAVQLGATAKPLTTLTVVNH
jgi:hypothetical protein